MYRETASTTDREQASSRGRHGLCLCGRKVTGISRPDGLTSRACVAHAGVRRESPVRASCGRERGGRTACAERAWRALGKAATLVQVAAAARESALRVARLDQVAKGHTAFALARLCRNDALSSALGPLFSTTRRKTHRNCRTSRPSTRRPSRCEPKSCQIGGGGGGPSVSARARRRTTVRRSHRAPSRPRSVRCKHPVQSMAVGQKGCMNRRTNSLVRQRCKSTNPQSGRRR